MLGAKIGAKYDVYFLSRPLQLTIENPHHDGLCIGSLQASGHELSANFYLDIDCFGYTVEFSLPCYDVKRTWNIGNPGKRVVTVYYDA